MRELWYFAYVTHANVHGATIGSAFLGMRRNKAEAEALVAHDATGYVVPVWREVR